MLPHSKTSVESHSFAQEEDRHSEAIRANNTEAIRDNVSGLADGTSAVESHDITKKPTKKPSKLWGDVCESTWISGSSRSEACSGRAQ